MATYPFIPYPTEDEWASLDSYQATTRDFDGTPFLLVGRLNESTPRPGTPVYGNARAQIRMSSKRGPILEYPAKLVDDNGRPFCTVDIPHYCQDDADTISIPKCNLFSALDTDIPRKLYNPNNLTATTTLWSIIAGLLESQEKNVRFSLRCEMQNRYPPPSGQPPRKLSALPEARKPSALAIPSPVEEALSVISSPPSEPESRREPYLESEIEPVALCQCGNPLPPRKAATLPPEIPSRRESVARIASPPRSPMEASPTPSVPQSVQPSRHASLMSAHPQSRQPSIAPPTRQPSTYEPVSSRRPTIAPQTQQPTIIADTMPLRRATTVPASRQPSLAPARAPSRQPSVAPAVDKSPFSDPLQGPPQRRKKVPGHGTSPALAPSVSTESNDTTLPDVPPPPTPPPLPPASAPTGTIHPRVSIIPPLRLASREPTLVGSPKVAPALETSLTEPAFPSPPRIGRVPTILSKLQNQPDFDLKPTPGRRESAVPAKKLPPLTRDDRDKASPLDDLRKALKNRRLNHRQRNVNDETLTIMTEALAALEQSTRSALNINDQMDDEKAMEVNKEVAQDLERLKQQFGEDLVGALKKLDDGESW
ncbi:hypothetical protein EJ05DRAFT_538451 [Pseudovirgaria hyperparasitica]|uniref:Uncharacterized protein n=1 Tax=Pseudovirgaria hyperparasitica TaxID=470096 RepID=A0A6A6W5M2_9PEZI|nr:uncharacterized protein EJ05DRAFT_538451 [Pseudovirgaria hyperparasitica]KAF2758228.1 hypothetical protein EJ05DRAFT_538451 [Pseudovirgaria hyperparasitica]